MVPKIDVRALIAQKEYTGKLNFSFEAEEELSDLPYVRFASPVEAELSYEIFEDDSVEARGQIAFTLEGLCSRCLAEARQRIVYDVCGVFTAGEPKDEEYSYRGYVDLSEFLRDSVLFALPSRLLCQSCEEQE